MRVDCVAAPACDFGHDRLKAAVLHLYRLAAAPAYDVVVMLLLGLAGNIRVLPARKIKAFERAEFGEEIKVPEERGAAQAEVLSAGVAKEIGRGEVAAPRSDEVGHGTARLSQPISGVDDRLIHSMHCRLMILSLITGCHVPALRHQDLSQLGN